MRCKNCNAGLSNDTKVCPYCGTNLIEQENKPNQINFNKEYTYPPQSNKGCGCSVGFFAVFTILLIGCMCLFPVLSMFNNDVAETIIDKSQLERSTTEEDLEEYTTPITDSPNLLLNLGEQERQLWNEDKTQITGSFLRILGDNYLFSKCSIEELKEFIEQRLKPFNDKYEYIVVDFPTSIRGLVYKDGIIQYGRLDKEEKTFKIRARTELNGTFDTSNEQDLRMLIKIIGLQENIKE